MARDYIILLVASGTWVLAESCILKMSPRGNREHVFHLDNLLILRRLYKKNAMLYKQNVL